MVALESVDRRWGVADEPPAGSETAEWTVGRQFGHYRLKKLLGSGGFGEVYEAFDTKKSRTVALKLLPPSYSSNPSFRTRLFREATTAGRLNEPHVVPIHDYGEIDGQLYIDMRLIAGRDLRAVIDEDGPMEPTRAVWIAGQIASALDAAHAEQIVHRDVKPANILLTQEDFACLVDFGLANAANDAKLTTVGNTIGTFAYMAPERLANEDVDHRTDIYALACVLYECLTGSAPYPIGDRAALIAAHLTGPIPKPSQQRPSVPAALDRVIAEGMAKNRGNRYSSAGRLAAAAEQAVGGQRLGLRDNASQSGVDRRRGRAPWVVAAVGLSAVVVTAVTVQAIGRSDSSTSPAVPPPTSLIEPVAPGAVVASIPVGRHPEGVVVDPTTHLVYVANFSDGTVSVIDAVARTVIDTVPVGRGPEGVAVDPGAQILCTADNREDAVATTDAAGRKPLATIPVGSQPWGVAIDPTTHFAYVANLWDDNISVVDLLGRSVLGAISIGKNPYGVAVEHGRHAVVTANGDGTATVIDSVSRTVTSTITIGGALRGVAVDPATHTAYITDEAGGAVKVIDLVNYVVTGAIAVGKHPYGVAVDSPAQLAYVANETDNTVSVIDIAKRVVLGTVRIGKDAWGVAVDPGTHAVYTTNHDNTVSVIVPRR